jgi:hypothetical protein
MSHETTVALTDLELEALVRRAFRVGPTDHALAILVDLPDGARPDRPDWQWRRALAAEWRDGLRRRRDDLGLEVSLFAYRNVRLANADLPAWLWRVDGTPLPASAEALGGERVSLELVLATHQIVLAPTELSATAPLKIAARTLGFRGATLPGLSPAMMPALQLDLGAIGTRVDVLKRLLDEAELCRVAFRVDGERAHGLTIDLRHRKAHASSGLMPEPGMVGNLPSGEAYVVPYEGEILGDASRTAGELPVELDGEVVVYEITSNRATKVLSEGPRAAEQAAALQAEPAYGNLAELGLGVLGGFGVMPCGEVLLDEKLGLHIAFGRSDHFGGQVGAKDFTRPEAVVHIDRVYVHALQPRVSIALAALELGGGRVVPLIRNDAWVVDFGAQRDG